MWLNGGTPATDATIPGIGTVPTTAPGVEVAPCGVARDGVALGAGETSRTAADGIDARDGAAGEATPGVGDEEPQAATRIVTAAKRTGRLSEERRRIAESPYARTRPAAACLAGDSAGEARLPPPRSRR